MEMGLDAKALAAAQAAADAAAAAAREAAELLRLALGMYGLPHCHVIHEADPDIKAGALPNLLSRSAHAWTGEAALPRLEVNPYPNQSDTVQDAETFLLPNPACTADGAGTSGLERQRYRAVLPRHSQHEERGAGPAGGGRQVWQSHPTCPCPAACIHYFIAIPSQSAERKGKDADRLGVRPPRSRHSTLMWHTCKREYRPKQGALAFAGLAHGAPAAARAPAAGHAAAGAQRLPARLAAQRRGRGRHRLFRRPAAAAAHPPGRPAPVHHRCLRAHALRVHAEKHHQQPASPDTLHGPANGQTSTN